MSAMMTYCAKYSHLSGSFLIYFETALIIRWILDYPILNVSSVLLNSEGDGLFIQTMFNATFEVPIINF